MAEERLQKILARAGVASRRKVEELIAEGRVTLNGRLAQIGDKADLERDAVKVDGKRIQAAPGHRYLLLNKPKGVMSTVSDPEGRPTVIELVPPGMRKALVPVGRLDYMTEGLLLLTDDGEFAHRVSHPRYGCVKTYEVKVKGHPTESEISRLEEGILLEGRRTSPCRITGRPVPRRLGEMENSWWYVELSEGRTRQIREMFYRIGHAVQKLRRVAIGPVADEKLPVGSLRELTEREVASLMRTSRPPAAKPAAKKPANPAKEGAKRRPAPAAKLPAAAPTRKPDPARKAAPARKPKPAATRKPASTRTTTRKPAGRRPQ